MSFYATGNQLYRTTQFQWAPSRLFHDPNPPILLDFVEVDQELTFTSPSDVWQVGQVDLSPGEMFLTVAAPSLGMDAGVSFLSSAGSLTFTAAGVSWSIGRVRMSLPVEGFPLMGTSSLRMEFSGTG